MLFILYVNAVYIQIIEKIRLVPCKYNMLYQDMSCCVLGVCNNVQIE